jgi:hypothetical protein
VSPVSLGDRRGKSNKGDDRGSKRGDLSKAIENKAIEY